MFKEILKIKVDFDALEKWRDPNHDDLPVLGFISLYRALGIVEAATKCQKENPDFEVIPVENIHCNFSTHRRLKSFIENNWKVFSIDIDADEHVFWDTSKFPKGKRHYPKKLKAAARNAVSYDFISHAPGVDDELGVNEIVFGVYEEDPKEGAEDGQQG